MNIKTIPLSLLACMLTANFALADANINSGAAPFSLTLKQVRQWNEHSALVDPANVSTEALAKRFSAPLNAKQDLLDKQVKVLIAPDGMNNFGNYITERDQFNLYNFTHWSNIDVLNWFAGTADQTINIPAKPWIDTAHKNGVKVIGSVFLGVARWGGSPDTAEKLLEQDAQGNFIFADKLIDIATYYGFDGWLMNEETDLSAIKDKDNNLVEGKKDLKRAKKIAKKMQQFTKYLTQNAPKGMEIHWYDSMIMTGEVKWQNELNEKNLPLIKDGKGEAGRVSDAMFLNYWWDAEMALESHEFAIEHGVNPYEVYYGADVWPERNAQKLFSETDWLHALFPKEMKHGLGSIAVFGINANYNFSGNETINAYSNYAKDGNDVYRFYDTETRFFAGDDLNVATIDGTDSWPGLTQYIPAKSPITSLPFVTSFNTGHGKAKYAAGKMVAEQWHDIGQQDVLPTWQFAVLGEGEIKPYFNFEEAYTGGSSLGLQMEKSAVSANIPLYQTQLILTEKSSVKVVSQAINVNKTQLHIWLEFASGQQVKFALKGCKNKLTNWYLETFSLADYADKEVVKVGLSVNGDVEQSSRYNLGQIEIN